MTSEKRLSPFQDFWGNLQQALSPLLRGARVLWTCTLLFCLVFSFARPAAAQITPDVTVAKDSSSASTTIASPVYSTARANELVLAFVATDYLSGTNTTVKSIAGGSLTWTLVKRTNAQSGTAEIWRAFATTPLAGVTVTAKL